MDGFVLLIDDLGKVEAVLERALGGTGLKIEAFAEPPMAKRRLIEATPLLIVSLTTFQNHPDGGFKFSAEVSRHEQLASIPLVLISDQLSEDVIRLAAESGAKSLIPWPVTIDSLKNRLRPYLGEGLAPPPEKTPAPEFTSPGGQTRVLRREESPSDAAASSPAPSGANPKINMAQQLLAKVLHDLKTSALLEVVDLEDVPRVVMEITRAVCGAKVSEQKPGEIPVLKPQPPVPQPPVPQPPVPQPPVPQAQQVPKPAAVPPKPVLPEGDVSLDLDAVFGRKKQ